jgi:hypothetical protein
VKTFIPYRHYFFIDNFNPAKTQTVSIEKGEAMDFLENFGSSFLFYFVLFMVVAGIAFVIRSVRNKQKEKGFRGYLTQQFPDLGIDVPMLMAKSESKKVKPDICLVIDEDKRQVIIMRNLSGKEITHKLYSATDLIALKRTNQMISRGFAPKTWSYEECLDLGFGDGNHYQLYIENISNRDGTDAGANAVRDYFQPWYEKLNTFLQK